MSKRFVLKRKIVRIETKEVFVDNFPEAVEKLKYFLAEDYSDSEYIEGHGTIEYTGEESE